MTRYTTLVNVIAPALAALCLTNVAFAQRHRLPGPMLPQPSLQSIFPLGSQRGQTVEIALRGADLEGVTSLWFDDPGLTATHIKDLTFKVVTAPSARLGHHDVRALGTFGVSNPRVFVVGDRAEMKETEPNNTPEQAKDIKINTVVNGEINPAADVDCFAFEAKKGQRLLMDVEAERVDSRLDATLHLVDSQDREIAENRDTYGADSFVDVTIPADGRYVIKLHDVTYRGSTDYIYRLKLTDGPHVEAIVPLVAKAGEKSTFTLFGQNLGGEVAKEVLIDGRPLERKTVTIEVPKPKDFAPGDLPRGFVTASAAQRRGFEYLLETSSGSANPVFVNLTDDPIVTEAEPNDDESHAQEIKLPCDISGQFGAFGDQDLFRFKAKKGDVWIFELDAERIGSAADPVMTIQKAGDGAKKPAQDLLSGEDLPDRGGQGRFNTATVDTTLRWAVPEDGVYQVLVSDLFGSQRGDVRLFYRLNIRPERPDFRLFVVPDSPNQPDALTLGAGGRSLAYVVAIRSDGFNGPIRVEAIDLPPQVRCESVVIAAGQSLAPVVFEAAADVKPLSGTVQLVGVARANDAKDSSAYFSGTSALGPDLLHTATGAGLVWPQPAAPPPGGAIPLARLTRGFVLKVTEPAPLKVTASPAFKYVTPGGLLALDLAVSRREGFSEVVTVTPVEKLPGDASNASVIVPKTANEGIFALTIPKTLAPGTYTLVLQGAGTYPFSKDPKAKAKPNVNLAEPSNPITVFVRPAPGSLALKGGGATLKAGASLEIEVTLTRKDNSKEPVPITLAAPAALKLTAAPISISPGKPVKLVLKSAADSPVGPVVGLAIRATIPVPGDSVDVDEPVALTIAK